MLIFSDDRLGYVDTHTDTMYTMDDYGNAVYVPFCFQYHYFQEH
jgi:hypothetical protein